MAQVIVEVSGGVARVESLSEEVDVLFFDWDDLAERCEEDQCLLIQHALWNGDRERARRLAATIYNGDPWPE